MANRMINLRAGATGFGLACVTGLLAFLLPREMARELFAIAMTLIGAAYYGFAFSSSAGPGRVVEVVTASLFVVSAILGLWVSPWFIALGLFAHGGWDLLHHRESASLASIPGWYIPFCVIYDWLAGAILVIWIVRI